MNCPRKRCPHPASAHEPEPIFDESENECGDCRACLDEIRERVAADRAARPGSYRPLP